MHQFDPNIKRLFRDYEGYFSFGDIKGIVIDNKITFLTIPYSLDITNNAFISAIKSGHLEIVKYLAQKGENIRIHYDDPLFHAFCNGHLDIVKYLVAQSEIQAERQGGVINDQDDYGFLYAIANGHFDVVKYRLDLNTYINTNFNLLGLAAENGHFNIVKYIIDRVEQGVHANDDVALRRAAEGGYIKIVKYLVRHGADIHAFNDGALRSAVSNAQFEVIEYLIEHGANKRSISETLFVRLKNIHHTTKLYHYLSR